MKSVPAIAVVLQLESGHSSPCLQVGGYLCTNNKGVIRKSTPTNCNLFYSENSNSCHWWK